MLPSFPISSRPSRQPFAGVQRRYTETSPELVRRAFEKAEKGGYGIMIVDTAGRSQLDTELMNELKSIVEKVPPLETLLVVDSMIGQEALNIAQGFRDNVSINGLMMTKMDGDSRGGAAISIRSVTGVPIKFIGTGEKLDALEAFDPARLSSRDSSRGASNERSRKSSSAAATASGVRASVIAA